MPQINHGPSGMEIDRFYLRDRIEPLPITTLVQRTLTYACSHFALLAVAETTLHRLQGQVELRVTPSASFRGRDVVDRYDMDAVFLYVRLQTVILIAGTYMVYASAEAGTICICTFPLISIRPRQKYTVLLSEPL